MIVSRELAIKIAAAIARSTATCLASRGLRDEGGELSSYIGNNAAQNVMGVIEDHFEQEHADMLMLHDPND